MRTDYMQTHPHEKEEGLRNLSSIPAAAVGKCVVYAGHSYKGAMRTDTGKLARPQGGGGRCQTIWSFRASTR